MRRGDYRDPLEIMLERERQSCKGCDKEITIEAWGEKHTVCKLKSKRHGKRCNQYVERRANGN